MASNTVMPCVTASTRPDASDKTQPSSLLGVDGSDSKSSLQQGSVNRPSGPPCSNNLSATSQPQRHQELLNHRVQIPQTTATAQALSPATPSPILRLQTKDLPATSCLPPSDPVPISRRGSRKYSAQYHPAAGMMRSASYGDSLSPSNFDDPGTPYSPILGSLTQMTPLPSPIVGSESPGPWNKFRGQISRHASFTRTPPRNHATANSPLVTSPGEHHESPASQRANLTSFRPSTGPITSPTYNNNLKFEWESKVLNLPLRRNLSKNGHERSPSLPVFDAHLHREKYLGRRRRTFSSADSSPALSGSATSLSSVSSVDTTVDITSEIARRAIKKQRLEHFEATKVVDGTLRKWRGIKMVGQGAFSKVFLATSEDIPDEVDHVHEEGIVIDDERVILNPRKYVAVKIVEHGAAGVESKERVESGLKRELDILKSVNHPCLIRLKAFAIEPTRALLVLPYCAGGDLFDLAASTPIEPPLIRRIFAEIVAALRYLHGEGIVHRDVKLENVLVNLPRSQLLALPNPPFNYPHPVITLTDVGLSRRVDFSSEDHLLTTRCGSDDYASPELIMSMPYDGRQTDAWALGVLLYALLEERLPFDPPPGTTDPKMRSKTAHRIARCEWKWVKLAAPKEGEEKKYDGELEGGKRIVEGLLKRALRRWRLDAVAEDPWVKDAIMCDITEVEE